MIIFAVPLTFVIGAGGSLSIPDSSRLLHPMLSPALDGFVGASSGSSAIGAHARFTQLAWHDTDQGPITYTTKTVQLFDVGPALQLSWGRYGRYFVEGWLGAHVTRASTQISTCPTDDVFGCAPAEQMSEHRYDAWVVPAGGLVVGVDLTVREYLYRPSLYVALHWSLTADDHQPAAYKSLTLGVALRRW
jgi:hypothetical protein